MTLHRYLAKKKKAHACTHARMYMCMYMRKHTHRHTTGWSFLLVAALPHPAPQGSPGFEGTAAGCAPSALCKGGTIQSSPAAADMRPLSRALCARTKQPLPQVKVTFSTDLRLPCVGPPLY